MWYAATSGGLLGVDCGIDTTTGIVSPVSSVVLPRGTAGSAVVWATLVEGSLVARFLETLVESHVSSSLVTRGCLPSLRVWFRTGALSQVSLRILGCSRTPCFTAFLPYTRISSRRQLKTSSPRQLMD